MRKLLFGAATAAMLVAGSPAFARDMDDMCCPSERANWAIRLQSQATPGPVCHLVRHRIETRKRHATYRTRRVCG
jgi:hypothetical protein